MFTWAVLFGRFLLRIADDGYVITKSCVAFLAVVWFEYRKATVGSSDLF